MYFYLTKISYSFHNKLASQTNKKTVLIFINVAKDRHEFYRQIIGKNSVVAFKTVAKINKNCSVKENIGVSKKYLE